MLEQVAERQAQTVLLVDAENLFWGAWGKTPSLLRALDDWARRRVRLPMLFRTYGHPNAVADNWARTQRVMAQLVITHVPNMVGKDKADEHLEADLAKVKDLPIQAVLGTGDQGSIGRCLAGVKGGSVVLSWVVFNRASPKFPPNPFGRGRVLEGFPRRRTAHIDKIYADWVVDQARSKPIGPGRSVGGHRARLHLVDPETVLWAVVRPLNVGVFDEQWRRDAVDRLAGCEPLGLDEARELASTLQAWLPQAIPEHHVADLGGLEADAWVYHCLSAVFARALVAGTPISDIEARMLRHAQAQPSELTERAYERAGFLVGQRQAFDQRAQYRVLQP